MLIAGIGVVVTGDLQARLMTEQQPMKMAAAEALYDTTAPASFSLFTVGALDGGEGDLERPACPDVLSFLATGSFDGTVEGINDLQQLRDRKLRARRLHAGHPGHLLDVPADDRLRAAGRCWSPCSGSGSPAAARTRPVPRWFCRAAVAGLGAARSLANSVGWIFTEMGRQPWVGVRPVAHRRRRLARRSAPPRC